MSWLLIIPPIAIVLLWLLFRPIPTDTLVSSPEPVADYPEALTRLQSLSEAEAEVGPLLDVCRSKLLTHGLATEHVVVLLHGYTNCPEQFGQLGKRFYQLGYNVFIPRLPYHGYADRMTGDICKLTAEDLVAYGDQAVDIARGLGRHVTAMGFSAGGVVAAWLAQNRADVEFAVPMSSSLGISFIPALLTRLLVRAFLALPRLYLWWDPRTREANPLSVYYAYPRYATCSLAQIMRLGIALKEQARRTSPLARNILVITNASEPGVNNAEIDHLTTVWSRYKEVSVHVYSFERTMHLPHDLMTPGTPGVPTEEVYDRLIEQVQKLHRSHSAE